jgi:phage tail sheath gpL-like
MAIAFPQIPLPFLPPLYYADIIPGQAPYSAILKAMLIAGQNRAGHIGDGAGDLNTPYILSGSLAEQLSGQGSMLANMFARFRANSPFSEVWGMMVPVDVGATLAVGGIRVIASPARSVTLSLRIAGQPLSLVARAGDAPATIASRIRSVVNSRSSLPVTATAHVGDSSWVDFNCKWLGVSGNHITIEKKFWGQDNSGANILTVVDMAGGAGDLLPATALAGLGKQRFDSFASGLSGIITYNTIDNFMDGVSGKWSPLQQNYGHWFTSERDTFSGLVTTGLSRNGPHVSCIGANGSPTPPWEWAAACAAHATQHWSSPPELSRPLQSLPLKDILPPNNLTNAFSTSEDNALLDAGISTWTVDDAHNVFLQRMVTMRRLNDFGDPDPSWRDAVTMYQTMYFARRMRQAVTSAFPRAALSTRDLGIPGFASPGAIKDLYIHEYKAMEKLGLVENSEAFASSLIVERNAIDATRVDSLIRPDFVNQLRIVANLIQTFLELDSTALQTVAA